LESERFAVHNILNFNHLLSPQYKIKRSG